MWPGTESNCRHEDFQSSYCTETMGYHGSLFVSIRAFNAGALTFILPIRTHSGIWFWQSCSKVGSGQRTIYPQLLSRFGIVSRMSRKGDCYDNAVMESFFQLAQEPLIIIVNFSGSHLLDKRHDLTVSSKSTSRERANRYVGATSARRAFGLRRKFLRAPQTVFPVAFRFLLDFRLTLAEPFNLQFEVFFLL